MKRFGRDADKLVSRLACCGVGGGGGSLQNLAAGRVEPVGLKGQRLLCTRGKARGRGYGQSTPVLRALWENGELAQVRQVPKLLLLQQGAPETGLEKAQTHLPAARNITHSPTDR